MLKALIVEDEVLARLGLHQLVDWNALGIELLEDAKNGLEAVERIRRHRPQLVLLDLNVPELNGIEIQRFIVDSGIPCRTIVISCNDDFTTVKEIMRLGAFDFLQKLNLSSEALMKVLLRCKRAVESDSSSAPAEAEAARPQRLAYEALLKNVDESLFAPPFAEMACVVRDVASDSLVDSVDDCAGILDALHCRYTLITRGAKGLYLLLEAGHPDSFYAEIRGKLEDAWGARVYLGIWRGGIGSFDAFNRALACVEGTNVFACYDYDVHILHFDGRQSFSNVAPFDFNALCSRLKLALSNLSERDILAVLSSFFETLRRRDMLAVNLLKRMLMDILGLFSSTAQRLHGTIEDVYIRGENYHYQELMRMNSLRVIQQWFEEFTRAFVEQFFIPYKCQNSDILRSVLGYIESNISQSIQLSAVARHVGISENYLSSFFKREMGETFVSYVNRRKVKKAQELLDANCLVYQVSESLGFENNTYFTKVFKKYAGMSPDAYRRRAQEDSGIE